MKTFAWLTVLVALVSAGTTVADGIDSVQVRVPYGTAEVPGGWPAGTIRHDRVVVKLAAHVDSYVEWPEFELPRQIEGFDRFLTRHGITSGRRALRERGLPVRDPELFRSIGLDRIYELDLPRALPARGVDALVRELGREPWVEYAEPVYIAQPTATPNDSQFNLQWAHVNTGQNVNGTSGTPDADADTDLAWDVNAGSSSVSIAILDTGVDLDHPDLVANLVAGFDYIDDDPFPDDPNGHGTAAAGIAAAAGNNGQGVAGVCWSCKIIPLRVSSSVDEASAMMFAADAGASAYNMSHTFGAAWLQIVIDATEYATGLGALGFASATNFNGYNIGTPAAYPEVVPVGGSNQFDVRIYSYSDVTDVTGPGPNTRSTGVGGGYTYFGGTSSSSPFAAGIAGLLRSEDPGLHVREIRHLVRLGCDDEVGAPAEDTPGWDQFMGYGRVNVKRSIDLVDGPWLALDRPHYVCAGEMKVALKDKTAGASVDVTLSGVGGDTEVVTVTPVAGTDGYYEGSISIAWAGVDGPIVVGDGTLDMVDGEGITAQAGTLAASAFMQCTKKVCLWETLGLDTAGDCDRDGALDPGEIWRITPSVVSFQTEEMFDVKATISTSYPDVTLLKPAADIGSVVPFSGTFASEDDAARIQITPGAAVDDVIELDVTISGRGWVADQSRCLDEEGWDTRFSFPVNRDLGPVLQSFDFDDGTSQGFSSTAAHGTGDLSECSGTWTNDWGATPVADRSHSGSHSMRLGNGTAYSASNDAGLRSPSLSVPSGGGALSFYMWQDGFVDSDFRAWDGLVVEAYSAGDFLYLEDGSYQSRQAQSVCSTQATKVPFGYLEQARLFAGDGDGDGESGDVFDVRHQVSLDEVAGETIRARFRFGSHDFPDPGTHGEGIWIDTVALHGPWTGDAWSALPPTSLAGNDSACDSSYSLSWDPVAGAGGYNVYRSDVSCADAAASLDVYGGTLSAAFADSAATPGQTYYYAVEALDAGEGCPGVRACIPGGCAACALPPDPTGLVVNRDGGDVVLSWDGSGDPGASWNLYRDPVRNPAGWGGAFASSLPVTSFVDVGGVADGALQYYLATEVTCGESALF